MSENETYGLRLEKKIDNMQSDIRMLSDHVTRLAFINEAQQTTSAENKKELELLDSKVSNLETKYATQEGGLSVIRTALGLFAGVIISACIWVASSIIQINQDQSIMKEKMGRLEEMRR